jgi:subtilisin-like proprotein convertase family protein
MKTIITCLFAILLGISTPKTMLAQVPQKIAYQAVVRDTLGNILPNQLVHLRLSITENSVFGITLYQETQSVTTNNVGLFNIQIGGGLLVSGYSPMSDIAWSASPKFLKVEMDLSSGGLNYVDMGMQQLVSVPYALSSADNRWTKLGNDISSNNSGNVGIGVVTPANKLTVNGSIGILYNDVLELGVGMGKDFNSGKIGYQAFSSDALDIVGAGYSGDKRKIKLWAESGTELNGDAYVKKDIIAQSLAGNGKRVLFVDEAGQLTTSNSTPTTFNSTNNNVPMPTSQCGLVTNTISVLGLASNTSAANMSVKINISQVDNSLFIINLISPSNQKINLFERSNFVFGDNFTNTNFSDNGFITVANQAGGSYSVTLKPTAKTYPGCSAYCLMTAFADFFSGTLNGTWTLEVIKTAPYLVTSGTIHNWSISFDNPNVGTSNSAFLQGINNGLSGGTINNVLKYASPTSATNSLIFDNGTNVGIGTSSPSAKLHVAGTLKIDAANSLELGVGLTKEANAGKIGYGLFTTDALDIIGGGTTSTNRKIKLWNEGGLLLTGNISMTNAADRSFAVDDVNVAASVGKNLNIKAGSSINTSGGATTGGDLVLQAGNGYNIGLPDAGGGDVIIRSGNNSTSANANISNGGSISLQTGGASNTFTSRIDILETGKIGVATATPTAGLDVNTNFKLGTSGSALNSIIKTSVTVASNNVIPSNSQVILTYAVPNAAVGAVVSASPASAFVLGIGIMYARVVSAGNVEICFRNYIAGTPTLAIGTIINIGLIQ